MQGFTKKRNVDMQTSGNSYDNKNIIKPKIDMNKWCGFISKLPKNQKQKKMFALRICRLFFKINMMHSIQEITAIIARAMYLYQTYYISYFIFF